MTSIVQDNLPPEYDAPYESALAAGFSDVLPINISTSLNIDTAPVSLLPHLAVQEGVRLWFDDWAEERKRYVIKNNLQLSSLVGTLPGLKHFLALVDAEMLDRVAYPQRFIFGKASIGNDPLFVAPFTARYLIKVSLKPVTRALTFGKSMIGAAFFAMPDLKPIERARKATVAAKSAETRYAVDFGWRKPASFADLETFDDWPLFGMTFTDRTRLD